MKLIAMTILMGVATLAHSQTAKENQTLEQKKITPIARNADELAEQLDISPEQAAKAWPIYTEYNTDQKMLDDKRMDAMRAQRASKKEMTDAEIEKSFYDHINSQREALDMNEAYFKKFMEVLPANKSVSLMRQIKMAKRQERKDVRNIPATPAQEVPTERLSK